MAESEKYPKLSPLVVVFSCLLLPSGLAYPAEEIPIGYVEPLAYQMSDADKFHRVEVPHLAENEKPKGCFHFFVSRNMSSLLSDATKMLQQVRDRREREWILTFIYRIKALAEHLRTHPDSRNYDCLPGEDVNRLKDSILNDQVRNPQQELYFVDESWPSSLQKRTDTSHKSDESESPPADNQSSHPLSSTGALREKSISDVSPEEKVEGVPSASEVPSSSAAGSAPRKPEAAEKLADSIPTAESAATTHPELNHQEKDDGHPEPKDMSATQSNDDSSFINDRIYEDGIILSSPPDCNSGIECEKALIRHAAMLRSGKKNRPIPPPEDDSLVQQLHSHDKHIEEEMKQQEMLKRRIRKALLEEMAPEVKKLRTVGGSEQDLINLWKQSATESGKSTETYHDSEFDYEEIGAAAGDLSSSDSYTTNDHTVAPSLSEVKNFKRQSNIGTKAYEPYDDSDVLVHQLFDVRFDEASSKTTKSLSDERDEYLITSTQVPY